MAKTTNRDLYEKSLRRIYSLSTRQLNMAYITWAYMLMGYEIKKVEENIHTFIMTKTNIKDPVDIKMINYSASKTVGLKANLVMLQNDIEKFYIGEVNKGVSASLLGRFVRRTSINDVTKYNDVLKETVKWLYTYNKAFAQNGDKIIFDSLRVQEKMTGKYVGSRILALISDVYDVNSKHMETLLSHNTNARPSNITKSSNTTYSYIYEGVPAVISATSEEEAEIKINQQYILSSMKNWDRKNQIVELEIEEQKTRERGDSLPKHPSNNELLVEEERTETEVEEKGPDFPIRVQPFKAHINEKNEMVYSENIGQQYFDFFGNDRDGAEK